MNLKNKKKWILLPLSAGVTAPLALLTTVSASANNEPGEVSLSPTGRWDEGIQNWTGRENIGTFHPSQTDYVWEDCDEYGTYYYKHWSFSHIKEFPESKVRESMQIDKVVNEDGTIDWTLQYFKPFGFVEIKGIDSEQKAYFAFFLTKDIQLRSPVEIKRFEKDGSDRLITSSVTLQPGQELSSSQLNQVGLGGSWHHYGTNDELTRSSLAKVEWYNLQNKPSDSSNYKQNLLFSTWNKNDINDPGGKFIDGKKTSIRDFTYDYEFQTAGWDHSKYEIKFKTAPIPGAQKGYFSGVMTSERSRQDDGTYSRVLLNGVRKKETKKFERYPVIVEQVFEDIYDTTNIPTTNSTLTKTITSPVDWSYKTFTKDIQIPAQRLTPTSGNASYTVKNEYLINDIIPASLNGLSNEQKANSISFNPTAIPGFDIVSTNKNVYRKKLNNSFLEDAVVVQTVYRKKADKTKLEEEINYSKGDFFNQHPYLDADDDLKNAYNAALTAAKKVFENDSARQPQVNAAYQSLNQARLKLNGKIKFDNFKEKARKVLFESDPTWEEDGTTVSLIPLNKLLTLQRDEAWNLISNAKSISDATPIRTWAEELNDLRKELELSKDIKENPGNDNHTNYTEATTGAKEPSDNKKDHFDEAIKVAENLKDISNYSLESINTIKSAKDAALVETRKALNGFDNVNAAKAAARQTINLLPNLSGTEKNNANNQVESQSTIAGVNDKLFEAQKLDAKNKIGQLSNLTNTQRDAAKRLIDSKSSKDQIDAIVNNATTVNNGVPKLTAAKAIKSNNETRYTEASPTPNKSNFDNAISALNDLTTYTNFDTAYPNLETKLTNLSSATANLDGVANLNTAKTNAIAAVKGLNLSDTQKDEAEKQINQQTTVNLVNAVKTNAEGLSNARTKYDEALAEKAKPNYIEATTNPNKSNFDNAFKALNGVKDNTNFTTPISDLSTLVSNMTTAINDLNGDTNLSTSKTKALIEIGKLTFLSPSQIQLAKNQVNEDDTNSSAKVDEIVSNARKLNAALEQLSIANNDHFNQPNHTEASTTPTNKKAAFETARNAVEAIKDTSDFKTAIPNIDNLTANLQNAIRNLDGITNLNNAKTVAKTAIDGFGSDTWNATQKQTAKNKIDSQNTIAGVNAELLEAQKQYACDQIDDLTNLSREQKFKAKELISSKSTNEEFKALVTAYKSVNNALGTLNDAKTAKNSPKYTEASTTPTNLKTAFDTSLGKINAYNLETETNFESLVDKTTQNQFIAAVLDLKRKTSALDGDKRLAAAKADAISEIQSYTKLDEHSQRDLAIAAVNKDATNTIAKVQAIKANAEKLNAALAALEAANAQWQTPNHLQAGTDKKEAYEVAKAKIDAIKSQNNFENEIPNIQTLTSDLNAKTAALNGDDRLTKAREAAIAKINDVAQTPQLSKAQKEKAIEAINNAQTLALIDSISANVSDLNNAIGQLKNNEAVKQTDDYKQSEDGPQRNFDSVVSELQSWKSVTEFTQPTPNLSTDLQRLQTAKEALNGDERLQTARQEALAAIDAASHLTKEQITAARNDVNGSNVVATIDAIKANVKNLDAAKAQLEKALEAEKTTNYKQASNDKKQPFINAKNAVNNIKDQTDFTQPVDAQLAKNLENAIAGLNGQNRLTTAKIEAKAVIEGMSNLSNAQKTAAKAAIQAADSLESIESIKNNASKLNDALGVLKDAVATETTPNYTQASNQQAFDDAKKAVAAYSNHTDFNNPISNIDNLKQALTNAKDDLDGEERLRTERAKAKSIIDNLQNITPTQVTAANNLVANSNDLEQIKAIAKNAQDIDSALAQAKEDAKVKQQVKYTEAEGSLQTAFDNALDKVTDLKQKVDFQNADEQLKTKLTNLTNAKNALNGETELQSKRDAAKAQIDKLSPLDEKIKNKIKDQIQKAANSQVVESIKNNANDLNELAQKLEDAKEIINSPKYTQSTPEEQQQFNDAKKAIENAIAAKSDGTELVDNKQELINNLNNAKDCLSGANKLKNAQDAALREIENLQYLSQTQKDKAKQLVNAATTVQEAKDIATNATNVDAAIEQVRRFNDVKSKPQFTEASTTPTDKKQAAQTAFDNLQGVETVTNFTTSPIADITKKTEALNNAIDSLDGQQNLDAAKADAKAKIEGLQHLSETQKDKAKQLVNAATTVQEAKDIVTNATNVDSAIEQVQRFNDVKSKPQFTEASTTPTDKKQAAQTAFDNLPGVESIMDFRTNLIDQITNKTEALKNAINSLDGKQNLDDAKAAAKAKIKGLENLSDIQKQAARAEVDKKQTIADVQATLENAKKLNTAKGALNAANEVEKTKAYIDASKTAKDAFNDAKDKVNAIKDVEDFSQPIANIDTLTSNLNNSMSNLDGARNLKEAQDDAIAKIDALINLTQDQKDAAKDTIRNVTTKDQVANVLSNAQKVDNAIAKSNEAADKQNTPAYVEASAEPKENFNKAKEALDAIKNTTNFELLSDDPDALISALDAKSKLLDGLANLATAKEEAKKTVDGLEGLSKGQKDLIKAAIEDESTNSKQLIDQILDNAAKLKELVDALEAAKAKQTTPDYTEADEDKQTAFTNAKEAIKDAIANFTNPKQPIANADNLLSDMTSATGKLNGDDKLATAKTEAIKEIDKLTNISKAQKVAAKDLIKSEDTNTLAKAQDIVNNAKLLNNALATLEAANNKLDKVDYTQASDAVKDAFDKAKGAVIAIKDTMNFENKVQDIELLTSKLANAISNLDGKDRLAKAKEKANQDIDALQNISDTQKAAAKAKVEKQNTIDNVNNIVSNTTEVDAALATIKDIVPVKEKVQFKEADADKQNALTTALDNLNSLESKEDFENAVENLQNKVQTLKNAHKALNGDSNLAKAKADAIASIDKSSYLSETQKEAAKSDINDKEAVTNVNNIVKNATLMNNAKEVLDKASKAQKTLAYTEASEQPKANFDAAKANVEAIKDITNFNEPVDNIVDLTNKLNNATAALDGSASLDAAKEEALKEVAKLSYLSDGPNSSDSEKSKASEAIKNATDAESLAKAIEDAKALNKANYDKKVDELNDLTNQYLQSTYGTDASNKHRENVVKAINEFNSKAFSDANGEAAIAKAQNLLDLVDSITTNKSRNNFEELADASDLANIDTLANAVIKHDYFKTSTKAKNKLNSADFKNIKQLVSKAGDIQGLNVLTTAITKALKDNSPMVIWAYFIAASVATWLIGMLIFVFGKKK
ncbi:hypothetical protein NPA13_01810 [Mycoplasma sp. 2045]|uniref:hypothetical protein n=1 Tax=Mycoplasma sp. 2045 TaxID=2967301 RepID=UPI00211C5458|nr:hypothetical protein [Mycoplasma sp. 2045]UUM20187.1 hypothetical protein NPA13_01810 [Mycoplasma sp. 2045]